MRTLILAFSYVCLVAVGCALLGSIACAEGVDETAIERAMRRLSLDQSPRAADATQTGALPGGDASAVILTRGNLPRLLAVALENALGQGDAKAMTLSLDLFSIVAASDSSVLWDQTRYRRFSGLRRVAGALTLGGGSDTTNPGRARELSDDVSTRLSLRLFGSRDRRDHAADFEGVKLAQEEYSEVLAALAQSPGLFERLQAAGSDLDAQAQVFYDALVSDRPLLGRMRSAVAHYNASLDSAVHRIDQSLLVTLHVAGEFHRAEIGRNRLRVDLVGEMGRPFTWTLNAGYTVDEAEAGRQLQELRVASGLSHRLLRGSGLGTDGIDVSMALAGEARNQNRLSVWSLNAKFDVPLQAGLRLTTSVTWANRREYVNERLVSGHMGLSYDLQVPGAQL